MRHIQAHWPYRSSFMGFAILCFACGRMSPTDTSTPATNSHKEGITFGANDGNGHPYVGRGMYLMDGAWNQLCSGSLISATVFLTAAHCGFGELPPGDVGVVFDEVYSESSEIHRGTAYANPAFTPELFREHDVAVIVLDAPVIRPLAALPIEGLAEVAAKPGTMFTSVGYGRVEPLTTDKKKFTKNWDMTKIGTRRFVDHPIIDIVQFSYDAGWYVSAPHGDHLYLDEDPTNGWGGSCYGDSGGPALYKNSNIVASITQDGDLWCLSEDITVRMDTQEMLHFLSQFVRIPLKVEVCHEGRQSLFLELNGVKNHIAHGDTIGGC